MDPKALRSMIDELNRGLDWFIPILCAIGLSIALFGYARNIIKKEGPGKGLYLAILALVEMIFFILIVYPIPRLAAGIIWDEEHTSALRWAILYLTIIPLWYFLTRKNSGRRGTISAFILLTTLLLGWLYDQWVGVLFVSVPILSIFYHSIIKTAQAIYPPSDPEDPNEIRQKTRAFIAYLLGIQFPVWVASAKASRDFDKRVEGDYTIGLSKPGIVKTWSHQVVGISKGIEFDRVDGPGGIFTGEFEAPVALVDLRMQIRFTKVNAVTKDGMEIPAIVFTAFSIDNETWPKDGWSKADYAKLRYRIGKNHDIDHPDGSFPYSSGRIRAALGTSGINTTNPSDDDRPEFFWDEWVVKQVDHATRHVISGRSLDELWRPKRDKLRYSALDEMAEELKKLLSTVLLESGVKLVAVRIVDYQLESASPITRQNIMTWSSHWEQKITETHADIEHIYREEIEKAHAYSKSVLLSAIADSLIKARDIREDLPRHVIAQYFVHALEEYIKKLPGLDIKDSQERIDKIKDIMLYSRSEESE